MYERLNITQKKKVNSIDYKELLTKYIKHVGECEGTNFIYKDAEEFRIYGSEIIFTDEEISELNKLSENG
jgi:hypothetical protein